MKHKATREAVRERWRNNLRAIRLEAHIETKAELERLTGIPQRALSKYEHNERLIPTHHALRLSEVLLVPLSALFVETNGSSADRSSRSDDRDKS